jgi:transitional endoplasmic reticulum ATPase
MTNQELKLKVMEAVQDDVNKGIVKIDSNFMKQLGVNPGDVLEISGERRTAAIVDRAYPGDIGLNIIRMDGNVRKNAKTSIGELVTVKKAVVQPATKISIAPLHKGMTINAAPEIFRRVLMGKAVVKGDIVSLGRMRRRVDSSGRNIQDVFSMMEAQLSGFGFGDIKFIVLETNPKKEIVVINKDTEIQFNPRAVELKEEEGMSLGVNYEDIGGLGEEIKKVREMVELPLKHPEIFEKLGIEPPKGVLLHGPPGTGKTLLAKAVASETQSHFILINGPEVMSKFYGESEANLRKKFEEAEENAPSIIFLDEIDAIATKREDTKGDVEKRVVAQLLGLMDGLKSRGKVIVIAATNMPNVVDPALRRPGRFDREIEIGVPGKEGRLEVLKIHTRNMPLAKGVRLKEIAKVTHGFVGADLNALAKEAAMIVLRRVLPDLKKAGVEEGQAIPTQILEKLMVTQGDFIESLKIVRPSAMREVFVETPDVSWEDVGGLGDVKNKLKEAVEWPLKKPEVFQKMGIRPPRGVLLYGPPGTGKTLLAKAVANESEANFILVNGPSLLSKWVNETPQLIKKLFAKARQTSPTIIFFDEFDSIAASRQGNETNKQSSGMDAINALLTEMDGLESMNDVLVLAATNRPNIIDPALLRQGRFDRVIYTPVPDEASRKKIFKIYTERMPLAEGVDTDKLAGKTKGYVGADIEGVCREAAMIALRENIKCSEVKMEHFMAALDVVKASVDKETEETYKQLENYFSVARANQIKQEKADYFG